METMREWVIVVIDGVGLVVYRVSVSKTGAYGVGQQPETTRGSVIVVTDGEGVGWWVIMHL